MRWNAFNVVLEQKNWRCTVPQQHEHMATSSSVLDVALGRSSVHQPKRQNGEVLSNSTRQTHMREWIHDILWLRIEPPEPREHFAYHKDC
jgi:hypothetical protein